jgi:hypothetical protein
MNELFEKMTTQELDAYARDGSLPEWFTSALGATAGYGPEGGSEG